VPAVVALHMAVRKRECLQRERGEKERGRDGRDVLGKETGRED
jgi:hypothetical protein